MYIFLWQCTRKCLYHNQYQLLWNIISCTCSNKYEIVTTKCTYPMKCCYSVFCQTNRAVNHLSFIFLLLFFIIYIIQCTSVREYTNYCSKQSPNDINYLAYKYIIAIISHVYASSMLKLYVCSIVAPSSKVILNNVVTDVLQIHVYVIYNLVDRAVIYPIPPVYFSRASTRCRSLRNKHFKLSVCFSRYPGGWKCNYHIATSL